MSFIEDLEQTRVATLRYFDLPDEDLERTYGPDKWNVRFVLHHLADSESILLYRIKRVISQPKQVIWAFDQDAWASALAYETTPLALSKDMYAACRAAVMHLAERQYQTSHEIEFVHSETGQRTLKDEFEKVVWHNAQHLATIAQALRG